MSGRLYRFLVGAVREPRDELSRRQRQVRFAIDLGAHCGRTLQRHRAEGMAAELSYRTIFSMIPVCVLGLVMFRAFVGLEQVQERLEQELFSFFGVPDVAYTEPWEMPPPVDDLEGAPPLPEQPPEEQAAAGDEVPTGPEEQPATAAEEEEVEQQEFRASIRRALSELVDQVSELNFASIGFVGVVLLIYAAIALLDSLEHIFNLIYESPTSRPWNLRIAIHWSIVTLGSGLLVASLYLSGQVVEWAGGLGVPQAVTRMLSHLLAIIASWVMLFLLYALMPNTKVSIHAAAFGAIVAAVLWEIAKSAFQLYVGTALPYSALYGTLGLIPLFLFWVYITWLIILFGLVWTYTLQVAPGRVPTKEEDEQQAVEHEAIEVDTILPVAVLIARAFERGEVVSEAGLSRSLGLPPRVVRRLCAKLEDAELVRPIGAGDEGIAGLTLARPADRIQVGAIVALADAIPGGTTPGLRAFLERLHEARCAPVRGMTLAELARQQEAVEANV